MMRIGPWVLGAGLALLAAGVVSTRADAWKTRLPAVTLPLTLAGIDIIDIRESGIGKVVISDKLPPQVNYPEEPNTRWRRSERLVVPPICRAVEGVLRCTAGSRFRDSETTMQLPPGRYQLLTRSVRIVAESGVDSLAVEAAGEVYWGGPAGELDITLLPPRRASGNDGYCPSPLFSIESGRIGALRVRAGAGRVSFGDLSEVGKIDVQAANGVGLSVDRAEDIGRIAVHPLSSTDKQMSDVACASARAAVE